MRLALDDERELLRRTFARLFAAESTPERVRAAEASGFDAALWKQLAQTGALGMRIPEAAGGGGASLLDAALVAEEAGRRLVAGPFLEALALGSLLGALDGPEAARWRERLADGSAVVTLALHDCGAAPTQLVPGGAVADAVVALEGDALVACPREAASPPARLANLGSLALARWGEPRGREVLARGAAARRAFGAALEEWKLLAAAALAGLAREALEIAARYASERVQFGRPIGAFQGIAHPLAESAAEVEGARLLTWRAIWAVAGGRPEAAALVSMSFVFACEAAGRAVARALHTHGGYGLSLEYDVQLYHRRAKAWPLVLGDPQDELARAADRIFGDAGAVPLPEAGDVGLDFSLGPEAERFAATARRFFEEHLDEELRAHAHFAWEGHHPGFQRRLAEAGLLYPSWPEAYGGQARGPYEMAALSEVFHEFGWTRHAIATTGMIGETLMAFGSEELRREVLPRIARGEVICSMGYTEPGSGSDVAAARTRAVRDGEEWMISGQKMFTSGAHLTQYVFLLTRTDPDAPKHRGLTMFLVPLDSPGIEVQPVETLSDERTNVTYYSDVRVPDRYRVGDVNGGWAVIAHALELEHAGGFALAQRSMLAGAAEWARATRRGGSAAIALPGVRARLARVAMHNEVTDALGRYAVFVRAERLDDPAAGPMAKFFGTDHFTADAADLMDLCAPDSLLQGRRGGGARGASAVEFAYRLSTAMAIYGGTSEIMKSIVAQTSLSLPRSRS